MAVVLKNKFRRKHARVTGLDARITGLLCFNESDTFQPFLVWDCSESGLGIWTPNLVRVGDEIALTIGTPFLLQLKGRVSWSERSKDGEGFRAGLCFDASQESKIRSLFHYFTNPIVVGES